MENKEINYLDYLLGGKQVLNEASDYAVSSLIKKLSDFQLPPSEKLEELNKLKSALLADLKTAKVTRNAENRERVRNAAHELYEAANAFEKQVHAFSIAASNIEYKLRDFNIHSTSSTGYDED
jgi:3-methyladenine DNA glycosylase AlkC